MTYSEEKAIERDNVIEFANLTRRLQSNEINSVDYPNYDWLLGYIKTLKQGLEDSGIIKIHKNGSTEFLFEEYKWLFRETLEG